MMLQNKFIKNCYQKKYGLFLSSLFRHTYVTDREQQTRIWLRMEIPERWQSGRMRRSRKPLSCNRGTGGSNPPFSATPDYSRPAYLRDGIFVLIRSSHARMSEAGLKQKPNLRSKLGVIWSCWDLPPGIMGAAHNPFFPDVRIISPHGDHRR